MAVKPITNKQAVVKSSVNRASQTSTRSETTQGNRSHSVRPGKDFTKGFSVTLKDIDSAVLHHVKNIMKPVVIVS